MGEPELPEPSPRPANIVNAHEIEADYEGDRGRWARMANYPRSNKIYWRGPGLIARLDHLSYDDGEPED